MSDSKPAMSVSLPMEMGKAERKPRVAGRLLTIWPDMPAPLAGAVNFFATTSMAQVMVFALIVVFLQFRPAGLFPQKGRMVEA